MKNSNNYEPSKNLKRVVDNKKKISISVIFIYIISIFVAHFLCGRDLEKTSFVSQIFGGVLVVGSLIISVLQYISSNVDNNVLREQEKKIKAAEMANQFQADIIPLSSILAEAYSLSTLKNSLLKEVENSKKELFNKEEVMTVLNKANIDKEQAFIGLCVGYLLGKGKGTKTEKGEIQFEDTDKKESQDVIATCINDLSNKLEYFCICFNSGIADEDTVYQSLHKVFFQCVNMLYVFIFINNETESDRLFSNISILFDRWHERYEQLVKDEQEELVNMKKKVQKKIVVKAKK